MDQTMIIPGRKDSAGVYVPPPLIYVAVFFLSILIQSVIPLNHSWLQLNSWLGWVLVGLYLIFCIPAIFRFIVSRTTITTIHPVKNLQTTGIYSISRNPMYLSLLFLYLGIAVFKGNWWTFFLVTLVIFIVQQYIIRREEQYLQRKFGNDFSAYCKKVRRWI
jgi:protein-S-isoprenylcysteine O-methyltransferase Ste14